MSGLLRSREANPKRRTGNQAADKSVRALFSRLTTPSLQHSKAPLGRLKAGRQNPKRVLKPERRTKNHERPPVSKSPALTSVSSVLSVVVCLEHEWKAEWERMVTNGLSSESSLVTSNL